MAPRPTLMHRHLLEPLRASCRLRWLLADWFPAAGGLINEPASPLRRFSVAAVNCAEIRAS